MSISEKRYAHFVYSYLTKIKHEYVYRGYEILYNINIVTIIKGGEKDIN